MNIIKSDLFFKNNLNYENVPEMIVLHHAAASECSIWDIHKWHLDKGWIGCGYHYLVRKDGSVYTGRDESTPGAHCIGCNTISIGICAEGNFQTEIMGEAQYNSLWQLISFVCRRYGINKIYGHRELNPTSCPGIKFPLKRIKAAANFPGKWGWPGYLLMINPGIRDENVMFVQQKLKDKGYSLGVCGVDGCFGNETLKAVKGFQKDSGLEIDGIVGGMTWEKLFS